MSVIGNVCRGCMAVGVTRSAFRHQAHFSGEFGPCSASLLSGFRWIGASEPAFGFDDERKQRVRLRGGIA